MRVGDQGEGMGIVQGGGLMRDQELARRAGVGAGAGEHGPGDVSAGAKTGLGVAT